MIVSILVGVAVVGVIGYLVYSHVKATTSAPASTTSSTDSSSAGGASSDKTPPTATK